MGSRLIFMLMVSCELAIYFGVTTMEGNFMCSVNGTTAVTKAPTNSNNTGNISFIAIYFGVTTMEGNFTCSVNCTTAVTNAPTNSNNTGNISFIAIYFGVTTMEGNFTCSVNCTTAVTNAPTNSNNTGNISFIDVHFDAVKCYGTNSSNINISIYCSGDISASSCNSFQNGSFCCINDDDKCVPVKSPRRARCNCTISHSPTASTVDKTDDSSEESTSTPKSDTSSTVSVVVEGTITTITSETNTYYNMDKQDKFNIGLIIGFTIAICSLVVLVAVISTCVIRRARKGRYNLQDLTNKEIEEKETLTDCDDQMQHKTQTTEHIYSDPNNKMYSKHNSQEQNQNLSSQPTTETGEYNHLDFTLRSESTQKFVSDGEYARARANTVSVFDQPWDSKPSKINKLFSSLRSSVSDSARNIRSSFLKRETSQKIPNEAMSAYDKDWQPPFLRDKDYLQNSNNKTKESFANNKHGEYVDIEIDQNYRTDNKPHGNGGFPVLPYSERLNVKCDNIYSEPYDRRISFRQRLSMMTSQPLKLPFGYELDFRQNRSNTPKLRAKSKIYSMAKSIDETDESLC